MENYCIFNCNRKRWIARRFPVRWLWNLDENSVLSAMFTVDNFYAYPKIAESMKRETSTQKRTKYNMIDLNNWAINLWGKCKKKPDELNQKFQRDSSYVERWSVLLRFPKWGVFWFKALEELQATFGNS